MNPTIQHKIEQYKKMASSSTSSAISNRSTSNRQDSLGEVIRTKKEADQFMAELESISKRSK
jgi:hypothetical protein